MNKNLLLILAALSVNLAPAKAGEAGGAVTDAATANFLNKAYLEKAVYKDYPQLRRLGTFAGPGELYKYEWVKDNLFELPACYAIDGARSTDPSQPPLIPAPADGPEYSVKNLSPLFQVGSMLHKGNANMDNLRANEQTAVSGAFVASGGPVTMNMGFISTDQRVDVGYFYITPKTKRALMEKLARAKEAYENRVSTPQKLGHPDPFFDYYFMTRDWKKAAEPYGDYPFVFNKSEDSEDFYLAMYCAFYTRMIPAFTVGTDVAYSGLLSARLAPGQDPEAGKVIDELTKGENLCNLVWGSGLRDYGIRKESLVRGKRLALKYFGEDYTEPAQDFPQGTMIYPFILYVKDRYGDPLKPVVIGGKEYPTYLYFCFFDHNFNVYDLPYSKGTMAFSKHNNHSEYIKEFGYGKPTAFTFLYRYFDAEGQLHAKNMIAWEDNIAAIPHGGDGDYKDIVMDMEGVEGIGTDNYRKSDFELTAIPLSSVKDCGEFSCENDYRHLLHVTDRKKPITTADLGLPHLTKTGEGWTSAPSYAFIEIYRTGTGADKRLSDYIVLRKSADNLADNDYNPYIGATFKVDYAVFDSKVDISLLDNTVSWKPLVEPFPALVNNWHENSLPVELGKMEIHDIFHREVNDNAESYDYVATFVSPDGYVMNTKVDRVNMPKAHIEVEPMGLNELHSPQAYNVLPAVLENGHYVSVKVAAHADLYGDKESVKSYTVMDGKTGTPLGEIAYDGDSFSFTKADGSNLDYIGAGDSEDGYRWVVFADNNGNNTYSYQVHINSELTEKYKSIVETLAGRPVPDNVYGVVPAHGTEMDNELQLRAILENRGMMFGDVAIAHVSTNWNLPEWTADIDGIMVNQWRKYTESGANHVAEPILGDKVWLNIAHGENATSGNLNSHVYAQRLTHFNGNGFCSNTLKRQHNYFDNKDVLSYSNPSIRIGAEYTVYAYIPDNGPSRLNNSDTDSQGTPKYRVIRGNGTFQSATTGVDDIITDGEGSVTPEYFDLQGRSVLNPDQPGVYIERRGTQTRKIVIE